MLVSNKLLHQNGPQRPVGSHIFKILDAATLTFLLINWYIRVTHETLTQNLLI